MSESTERRPLYARRLYLMRHGDVSYFDEQGRPAPPNDVKLTLRGQQQAEAAAQALAGIEFQRVISSDLPRTIATAETVAGNRGILHERRKGPARDPAGPSGRHSSRGSGRSFLKGFQ